MSKLDGECGSQKLVEMATLARCSYFRCVEKQFDGQLYFAWPSNTFRNGFEMNGECERKPKIVHFQFNFLQVNLMARSMRAKNET